MTRCIDMSLIVAETPVFFISKPELDNHSDYFVVKSKLRGLKNLAFGVYNIVGSESLPKPWNERDSVHYLLYKKGRLVVDLSAGTVEIQKDHPNFETVLNDFTHLLVNSN